MIVAMAVVRVVQVIADEVVDVIAVWHGVVSATIPVHVGGIVAAAAVTRLAGRRVRRVDRDHALVDVVAVGVVEVTIVHVVDMAVVLDGAMTTAIAVNVFVPFMNRMGAHRSKLAPSGSTATRADARSRRPPPEVAQLDVNDGINRD